MSTTAEAKQLSYKPIKYTKKAVKRIVPLSLAAYFFPFTLAFYVCCGFLEVMRNKRRTISTIDRYFAGNGVFTWIMSPFNLLMDLISLPYWNKGIYKIEDLPKGYQEEIQKIIDVAHSRNLVAQLSDRSSGCDRGMFFFKWYGRN